MGSNSNDVYQDIDYRRCEDEYLIEDWVVRRNVNDPSVTNVADLLSLIHAKHRSLLQDYEEGDLRLYTKGTRIDGYQNEQVLMIDTSPSDLRIQETSEDDRLHVVVSAVNGALFT